MTAEEINAARRAGHLADVMSGRDPDATVQHLAGCPAPKVERLYRLGDGAKVTTLGDSIRYRCATWGATTKD